MRASLASEETYLPGLEKVCDYRCRFAVAATGLGNRNDQFAERVRSTARVRFMRFVHGISRSLPTRRLVPAPGCNRRIHPVSIYNDVP